MVETDSRAELADLLADLAAYAAWQGLCGAEILPAESVVAAASPASSAPRQSRSSFQKPAPSPRHSATPSARKPPPNKTIKPRPPHQAAEKPQQPKPPRTPPRRQVDTLPSAWAQVVNAPKPQPTGGEALRRITEGLGPGQTCPECQNRLQVGRGEPTASIALISAETLVPQGRKMLAGMLKRVLRIEPKEVFFIPVNRCPTHHRSAGDGARTCATLLADQLSAVRPELILAFGRDASRVLFSPERTKVRRGHWTSYPTEHGPLPALMTFHPNFLLQHPENKGHAFADLKAFRAKMDDL